MSSDIDVQTLSPDERARLLAQLIEFERLPTMTERTRRFRAFFLKTVMFASALMIPWIVYLAWTLPHRYVTTNWDVLWAGFDVLLLVALALTSWAMLMRRQMVIVFATIAGTLLTCDAWFDIVSSRPGSDRAISVASALLIEIPLAVLFFVTVYRLIRLNARTVNVLLGGDGNIPHLWKLPLMVVQVQRFRRRHLSTEISPDGSL